MRIKIICGNWKMNKTKDEAVNLALSVEESLPKNNTEVVICPPFPYLDSVKKVIKKVKLGAQNCYSQEKGAFTGEVSPVQVKEFCDYVILGHSERRRYQKETDEEISLKVTAALKAGLTPIICIGENLEERDKGLTNEVLHRQLKGVLKEASKDDLNKLIIAYEPIWSISTTKNRRDCDPEAAEETVEVIENIIDKLFGQNSHEEITIFFGGNVNPQNAAGYLNSKKFDGVLPGGASLKADEFIKIIESYEG